MLFRNKSIETVDVTSGLKDQRISRVVPKIHTSAPFGVITEIVSSSNSCAVTILFGTSGESTKIEAIPDKPSGSSAAARVTVWKTSQFVELKESVPPDWTVMSASPLVRATVALIVIEERGWALSRTWNVVVSPSGTMMGSSMEPMGSITKDWVSLSVMFAVTLRIDIPS